MSKSVLILLFAAFLVFFVQKSLAKDSIGGQIFANSYIFLPSSSTPTTQPGETGQNSGAVQNQGAIWLDGDYDFSKITSSHVTLTASEVSPSVISTSGSFSANVREAYINVFSSGIGFKIGRQIISWGKSDGICPTDYFSGFDYTILNPDREYQRMATNAALLSYSPNKGRSHFNFTAVLVADAPRSKILPAGTTDSGEFINIGDADSDVFFKSPEAGVKLSYTGRSWDASISAYVGQDHNPNFQPVGSTGTSLTVDQYYQKIWATGGDFSVSLGSWVLRGESAYTSVINPLPGPAVLPDHFDSVFGIERPLGEYFRFGIQGLYRYIPNWQAPSTAVASAKYSAQVLQGVATANQLIEGTQFLNELGESLRIEFDHPKSGITMQLFFLYYDLRKDSLFLPMFTYHWSSDFKTFIGVNDFNGPSASPFGQYSVYNSWFVGGVFNF